MLLFLTLFLVATGFSGCADFRAEWHSPNPRVGDQVVYEYAVMTPGYSAVDRVHLSIHDATTLTLPDGHDVIVHRVLHEGSGGGWNWTIWTYVEADSMRVVGWTDTCAKSAESASCTPVTHSFSERGAPWAFGSSLVHGAKFRTEKPLELVESLDGRQVAIRAILEERTRTHATLAFEIIGPEAPNPTAPSSYFPARLTLERGNPYATHAELHGWGWDLARERPWPYTITARQVSYEPGEGTELVRTTGPPPWRPCGSTVPHTRIMPPGDGYVWPELNLSLREFVEHLTQNHEGFKTYAERDDSLLVFARMRMTGWTEGIAGLLDEHWYEADIGWPEPGGTSRVVTVAKKTEQKLIPPGEDVAYWSQSEHTHRTALPTGQARQSIVPLDAVAEAHFSSGLRGVSGRLHMVEFQGTAVLQLNGEVHVKQSLELLHMQSNAGPPVLLGVFRYDLGTGCLVHHEPGVRNS